MDEQKVEAMLAPQEQPSLADDDQFPTLGSLPAAPAEPSSQPPSQPLPAQPEQVCISKLISTVQHIGSVVHTASCHVIRTYPADPH